MKLVIANHTYSSWSLRPWLLLKPADIPFEQERISFNDPQFKALARRHSPTGKVPALVDGDLCVLDSLAIAEYVAGKFPGKQLWPADVRARARPRSVCAEMHSGFQNLRSNMTMNITARLPGRGWNLKVQSEINRICEMWGACRREFGAAGLKHPLIFLLAPRCCGPDV